MYSAPHHREASAIHPHAPHSRSGRAFRRSHNGAGYPPAPDHIYPSARQASGSGNHRSPA